MRCTMVLMTGFRAAMAPVATKPKEPIDGCLGLGEASRGARGSGLFPVGFHPGSQIFNEALKDNGLEDALTEHPNPKAMARSDIDLKG